MSDLIIKQEEERIRSIRQTLAGRKRIVIKIGTSSLTHPGTGALNLTKLEILVRELCDLKNRGKVSSAVLDLLREHGCLKDLAETNQVTLFQL